MKGLIQKTVLLSALAALPLLGHAQGVGQDAYGSCYRQCIENGSTKLDHTAEPSDLQALGDQCLSECESLRPPLVSVADELKRKNAPRKGGLMLENYYNSGR